MPSTRGSQVFYTLPARYGLWEWQHIESEGVLRLRLDGKTITVWYHQPTGWNRHSPVLFVMHGVKRNARNYRNSWVPHAEHYNFLLVVPEFSRHHYPGTQQYNLGNIFSPAGHPRAPSQWTYTLIEHIFDALQTMFGRTTPTYSIYGHSAGAQFVHRMLFFLPQARIDQAICANAGWYMLPSYATSFPYGLRSSGVTELDLQQAFRKRLLVLLGEDDTHPTHKHLKQSLRAQAQGEHRYERGQNFYHLALREARRLQVALRWKLIVVPEVGHNNTQMASEAVDVLYGRSSKRARRTPNKYLELQEKPLSSEYFWASS